jgi:hypothetical protein
VIVVVDVGSRAEQAMERAASEVRVLAALSASVYLTAGDEVLWLGRPGSALHPRAMLTADPLPVSGAPRITLRVARRWHPPSLPEGPDVAGTLSASARGLVRTVAEVGVADGFGTLLHGRTPAFPLDGAAETARALARACTRDDADAAGRAAVALLGLGPGLTPAGDDYVGGAFFARALLARWQTRADAWERAAREIRRHATTRTHRISAALLGDLLDGQGHAPLHELAARLAGDAPRDDVLEAARRLTRIGHSSGWDMLAGFVAGLGQLPAA